MLSIRLSRVGKKHQPAYRLIVVDRRKDPWGDYLENVGVYDPVHKVTQLKAERVKYWLKVGAQPSPTVWNMLIDQKIVEGRKMKATTGHKGEAAKDAKAPETPNTPKA